MRGPSAGRVSLPAGGQTREAAAACGKLAGARSRPAALSSNYRADRSALSGLHAQLAKRRVTAAGPLALGCPVELFLKGMASVCSLRDVSWRGLFGGSESN